MGFVFLVLIIAIPIADLASLIAVGGRFGILTTIAMLVLAGLAGTALVRWQGLAVGTQARESLAAGRLPVVAAFDSVCLLLAGGLFMLPGFVSDGLGLLLLLPPVRTGLRLLLGVILARSAKAGGWVVTTQDIARDPRRSGGQVIDGEVIDGEVISSGYAEAPEDPTDRTPDRTTDRSAASRRPPIVYLDPSQPEPPATPPGRQRSDNMPPGVVRPDDPC